jgi:hypothetical protein
LEIAMSTLKAFRGYVASPRGEGLKSVEFVPQSDPNGAYMGVWVDGDMADDIETPAEFTREYGTLFGSIDDFKQGRPLSIADYWVEGRLDA